MDGQIDGEQHTNSIIAGKTAPFHLSKMSYRQANSSRDRKKVMEGFALLLYLFSKPHSNYSPVRETHEEEEAKHKQKEGYSALEYNAAQMCWVQGSLHCPRMWMNSPGGRCPPTWIRYQINISPAHLCGSIQYLDFGRFMNIESWVSRW